MLDSSGRTRLYQLQQYVWELEDEQARLEDEQARLEGDRDPDEEAKKTQRRTTEEQILEAVFAPVTR